MSVSVRTLIVDDEPLARQRLRGLLGRDPEIEVIGECGDGQEAVAAVREHRPDLVFLDVQMPVLDGLGVLEALGPENVPVVVFVTAYDRYAVRAFEVHALDYLLKPFDRDRFDKALERAKAEVQRARTDDASERVLALLEELKGGPKPAERLVIKSADRVFLVRTEDVDWIEAAGNYVRIHVGKEAHLLRETMNALETRLDPARFLRIHRSTIVNIERIRELQPLFHGDYVVILQDGTQLTLTRGYRQKLPELFGNTP